MTNWYYVQGSERIGPVTVEALNDLFKKNEINNTTYVWRKGFQDWEKMKDVVELNMISFGETKVVVKSIEDVVEKPKEKILVKPIEKKLEKSVKEVSSPEIHFNFNWDSIKNNEEIFFLKIGNDRKTKLETSLFGPYSLTELEDAIGERRINNQTLIFAAGMSGWIKVGDTPLDPKNIKLNIQNVLAEAPLLLAIENNNSHRFAIIEEAGINKCTLLGSGIYEIGKEILCSIYSGTKLRAKNIKLNIENFNSHDQKIFCHINEISENAKEIMKNFEI